MLSFCFLNDETLVILGMVQRRIATLLKMPQTECRFMVREGSFGGGGGGGGVVGHLMHYQASSSPLTCLVLKPKPYTLTES